jgi:pimeloyl-ACP methyl ester carboxylesterase
VKIIQKKYFRVSEADIKSDKVIFVFTAMGTKIWLYRPFLYLLKKHGYSTVTYDYPPRVLFDGKFDQWDEFYAAVITDAQERLALYEQRGVHNFYCYGVSMGTLIANKFTRKTKQITHVILNLTYGDVADTVWHWSGTKRTRKSLEAQGIGIDGLRENLKHIDPIENASGLKGKKVLLFLARKDKVLLNEKTSYTRMALEIAGVDVQYFENRYLGHYPAGAKNSLQIKRLDTFLSY